MARLGIQFFATPEDLKEVIEIAEAKRPFSYVLTGLFDEPSLDIVDSLLTIPEIGIAPAGDAVQCPGYLACARPFVPAVQSVLQRGGGTKYAIDQLENPQTIVIRPGGVYAASVVIAGSVGTVSKDSMSVEIYRLFTAAIRKCFQSIKSYRVGRNAARLLDSGARLTRSVRSPTLYDLTRD